MANVLSTHPEKFNSIGSATDPLPFSTVFTGLLLVNLYYWGTDQGIIQRALGAKNLEHGQKGVMLAGLFKVFTPLILIVPGIIAFHIYGSQPDIDPDLFYSKLVRETLPPPLLGFFAAVMFGAILSSFNSFLNSSATLVSINLYKERMGNSVSDMDVVKFGKKVGILIAIIAMCIAPLIENAPDGLFQYLQTVNGFFNVPIFTIIFMGYATKYVPAIAAKVALVFFVFSYALLQLVIKPELHFLHLLALLFFISCVLMLIIGKLKPRKTAYKLKATNKVDLVPWKYRKEAAIFITTVMITFFIIFSKYGLAGGTWSTFLTTSGILWGVATIAILMINNKNRSSPINS